MNIAEVFFQLLCRRNVMMDGKRKRNHWVKLFQNTKIKTEKSKVKTHTHTQIGQNFPVFPNCDAPQPPYRWRNRVYIESISLTTEGSHQTIMSVPLFLYFHLVDADNNTLKQDLDLSNSLKSKTFCLYFL